jgi:hypothetical protein
VPGVPGCFKFGFVAINICKSNVKVAILFRAWINYAASKRVPFLFSCAPEPSPRLAYSKANQGSYRAQHH